MAGEAATAKVAVDSLMIVHFIEQQLEGWTFERRHWPLHVTLVPWFRVDDEEAVVRSLERLARDVPSFTLKVGPIDMFGPTKKIPVNLILNQQPIRILHTDLLADLEEADIAAHEQPFIGDEYTAHITRHNRDNRHSNEGERVIVKNFQLVKLRENDVCETLDNFSLKEAY